MSFESVILSEKYTPEQQCFATKTILYKQKPWTHVQKRKPVMAEYPTPGLNAMPMPFLIGRQVLNSAITRRPAWSLRNRLERELKTYPVGPASHTVAGLSARGGKVTSPAFTMRERFKQRDSEGLPGPSTYDIKMHSVLTRAPTYSLRKYLTKSSKNATPGPNEYDLPKIFGHHHSPPSFSLGNRQYNRPQDLTPGPDAYADINMNAYLHAVPAFSLRDKAAERLQENKPGPNAYCPERVILNKPFAPRPSFGIKHTPYLGKWNPRIIGPRCLQAFNAHKFDV